MTTSQDKKSDNFQPKLVDKLEQAGARGTILIVDDQDEVLEITRKTIEKHTDFQVITASTGKEALAIIDKEPIDVIILDYVMPEMNGAECFRSILDRSLHTPVIFLTGYPTLESKNTQLALGAFDYIEKPVHSQDFILLLKDAHKARQKFKNLLQSKATAQN